MTDVILRTENLEKRFGQLEVLKGITTAIRRGEVVSIIGPSGGGKSTFLRCLNLLETPDGGKVFYKEQDVTDARLNIAQYRQSIGMVFQHFNVFPNMTVLENVTLAPVLEKKVPKEQARAEAMALLERVGLGGKADEYPRKLSGGQKQRLAIASAMAAERSVVFLDEPTSGLDYRHMLQTAQLLKELRQNGKTVYVITHDPELICQCCTDILHLEAGRIAESFPMDQDGAEKIRRFFRTDDTVCI